jgi:SCP1.201-like deaminase
VADEWKQLDFLRKQEEQKLENLDVRAFGGREHLPYANSKAVVIFPPPLAAPPPLPKYNGTTSGVLITNEGQTVPLQSGDADPAHDNYPAAAHAEGKAAMWIRQNGSSGGVVYHNNPKGTCQLCRTNLPTLLPKDSVLTVVPPADAAPPDKTWIGKINSFFGNSSMPKPPEQEDDDNLQLWP